MAVYGPSLKDWGCLFAIILVVGILVGIAATACVTHCPYRVKLEDVAGD